MEPLRFCLIFIVVHLADGAVPGTFFWKPRLGIDLTIPSSVKKTTPATMPNIREGIVVLIDGYEIGMTMIMLTSDIADAKHYAHLNPTRGYFYTNSYRWALRHFSTLPIWLAGKNGNYHNTHAVWNNRFEYINDFIPTWMRYIFPYVSEQDWNNEVKELRRFQKFSEHAFSRFYKFPGKTFNKYKSFENVDTTEVHDSQSSSFDSNKS